MKQRDKIKEIKREIQRRQSELVLKYPNTSSELDKKINEVLKKNTKNF